VIKWSWIFYLLWKREAEKKKYAVGGFGVGWIVGVVTV